MKRIEVAVGVVYNHLDEMLVGQRVVKDLYFDKWEFPEKASNKPYNESLKKRPELTFYQVGH